MTIFERTIQVDQVPDRDASWYRDFGWLTSFDIGVANNAASVSGCIDEVFTGCGLARQTGSSVRRFGACLMAEPDLVR